MISGVQCVCKFHIGHHLLCWTLGVGATNSFPYAYYLGVSYSRQHAHGTLNSTQSVDQLPVVPTVISQKMGTNLIRPTISSMCLDHANVCEFHITSHLLCWASGGRATNNPSPCPIHGCLIQLQSINHASGGGATTAHSCPLHGRLIQPLAC